MTLHPDAKCKYLLKNYKMPDEWLNDIYSRQMNLQDFITSKRNGITIPKSEIKPEHIYESLYHYTCMMMETREFKTATDEIERDFEFIDVLFFLCNIGIYAGVKKVFYLDNIQPEEIEHLYEMFNDTILEFLDSLPFKKWKTYKPENYDTLTFALEKFNQALNYWIAYGIYVNGYSEQHIYDLYRSKLEENKNRQTDKSKGYI